ncbi:hypothetical protein VP01_3559g1 [Puccinia sorghi]|uniref:Uncharacterized protein n=1 Tax=Puccinia sorghi TaxID=27349 RepID=A0A0L6UXA5_9BASI|nr:hypothetical protein VP01_3559g1 [Puccinia sorghi]
MEESRLWLGQSPTFTDTNSEEPVMVYQLVVLIVWSLKQQFRLKGLINSIYKKNSGLVTTISSSRVEVVVVALIFSIKSAVVGFIIEKQGRDTQIELSTSWKICGEEIRKNRTSPLQKKLTQLPAVDKRHDPAKLPSKLHLFACVDVLAQSLFSLHSDCASNLAFLDLLHVNCRQLSKMFFFMDSFFIFFLLQLALVSINMPFSFLFLATCCVFYQECFSFLYLPNEKTQWYEKKLKKKRPDYVVCHKSREKKAEKKKQEKKCYSHHQNNQINILFLRLRLESRDWSSIVDSLWQLLAKQIIFQMWCLLCQTTQDLSSIPTQQISTIIDF